MCTAPSAVHTIHVQMCGNGRAYINVLCLHASKELQAIFEIMHEIHTLDEH